MKRILDEELICKEYTETNAGVEMIALKYHVGKKKIKDILLRNNVEIKKRGGQCDKITYIVSDPKKKKYVNGDGFHYVVIDPQTNFKSTDINNLAGVLTTYIKDVYAIETPSLYDRRKYYMETGNYWWEQWLVYEKEEDAKTKKCPYCEWCTSDMENKSGAFEQHLRRTHNINKEHYLKEHPEDKEYFKLINPVLNLQMDENEENFVICKICGKKLTKVGNSHLKIHGITKNEYIEKYGDENIMSKTTHNKFVEIARKVNIELSEKGKDRFTSNAEKEILQYLSERGIEAVKDRKILNGKELDIYIPNKKIAIEYNGNVWHTEGFGGKDRNYHITKLRLCNEQGVKLVQICDDEYLSNKELILNKLSHIIGIDENKPKVYGRNTIVREIYKYESDEFLDKYHIQGQSRGTLFYGCFYNDILVGVMVFKNGSIKNSGWELTRFATDYHYVCCGVGGKLFAKFIKDINPEEVFSFADRRWTVSGTDNIYTKLGFKLEETLRPDYKYYLHKGGGNKRIHKMSLNKKVLSKKYGFDKRLTESEMTKALGYDRIWDCGLFKYVWRKE